MCVRSLPTTVLPGCHSVGLCSGNTDFFESGKLNHQGSVLSQVTGCTSGTQSFFFFFFGRVQQCKLYSCSLICFTSCMYMYLVLFSPKKGTRIEIMGYCLSATNLLYLHPGTQNSCVSSAKCSTAAQCLVYYHTSGLVGRHGKAFERNKHQGRGSFMLNFGLGSCRRISKKQDWCTVWGFCRESYQSTAVSPDSLQLITDLLIQPNHSCMENQRRLGSV